MLKVAIDSGPLSGGDSVRGIGVYVRELTKVLKNVDIVDISKSNLEEYNIVHLTRFNPFRVSVPFKKPQNTKFVLTIYDLIPLIYPNNYPPGVKGSAKWLINKFLINKNVDAVITISETSKKDICRFTGIDPDKVFVTYLAPRKIFKKISNTSVLLDCAMRYKLPKKFVLYVGDVNYNKNIPNLIKACKVASKSLVIAGKQALDIEDLGANREILKGPMDYLRFLLGRPHPELVHHKELHMEFQENKEIHRLGFVPENDLAKIYNLASVYVQPSFYEGFGFPILEAIACGTPVAVSQNQCHVEILGSEFDYFDPKNPESIAKALISPNGNRKLPRPYSWEATAKETLKVYAKI